jgi:DNA-binding transcriptional ArsR family regulator
VPIGLYDLDPPRGPSDRTIAGIDEDNIYRPSRHLEQAATMRVLSTPISGGWRRCAAPASSNGSTRTNGASPTSSRRAPPRMTVGCFDLANHISTCLCDGMTANDIFRALADPTRRAIFEKLAAGGMNASALREGMKISQPAMSQHLSVLRSARLVREERQGRFVNYEVDPEGLALIAQWLAKYRAYWPARIEALKVLLKDMDQ